MKEWYEEIVIVLSNIYWARGMENSFIYFLKFFYLIIKVIEFGQKDTCEN